MGEREACCAERPLFSLGCEGGMLRRESSLLPYPGCTTVRTVPSLLPAQGCTTVRTVLPSFYPFHCWTVIPSLCRRALCAGFLSPFKAASHGGLFPFHWWVYSRLPCATVLSVPGLPTIIHPFHCWAILSPSPVSLLGNTLSPSTPVSLLGIP